MPVVVADDVHWIVSVFQKSGVLVQNRDRLSGGLGIEQGELVDIRRAINLNEEESYGYFTRVLNKWIVRKSEAATFENLVSVLREEGFNKTAGDLEEAWKHPQFRITSPPKSIRGSSSSTNRDAEFWNIPARNINFVGRRDILEELDKYFSSEEPHALIGAICGLGGVGKSSVALEYAWTRRQNFKGIYWFHAEQRTQLMTEYAKLARKLRLTQEGQSSDDITLRLKEYFEQEQINKWLVIYDNAPNYDDISDVLPVTGGNILVTSRFSNWHEGQVFDVNKFSLQETIHYVRKILGMESCSDILHLGTTFDRLPLAIAQACAYIKYSAVSIQKYLQAYNRNKVKWLARNELPKQFNTASVFVTWDVTMAKIKEKFPLAARWLEILAVLNADGVPYKLLKKFLKWSKADEDEFGDVLLVLTQFSLINVDKIMKSTSIHRLLQEVIILKTVEQERERIILTAFFIISSLKPFIMHRDYRLGLASRWVPHCDTLFSSTKLLRDELIVLKSWDLSSQLSNFTAIKVRVLFLQAVLTFLCKSEYCEGNYDNSELNLKELLDIWMPFFGENSIVVANCCYELGHTVLENPDEAIEYLEQALRIYSKHSEKYKDYCMQITVKQAELCFLHMDYGRSVTLLHEVFEQCELSDLCSPFPDGRSIFEGITKRVRESLFDYTSQLIGIFSKSISHSTTVKYAFIIILISIECTLDGGNGNSFMLSQLLDSISPEDSENTRRILSTYTTRYWKMTVLFYACFCDNKEAVKLLLDFGVDPAFRNSKGETALHYFVSYSGFSSVFNELIDGILRQYSSQPDRLASIFDAPDSRGFSPLRNIVVEEDNTLLEAFLSKTASYIELNRKDMTHDTPVLVAIAFKNVDILKTLFKYGASATDRDDQGIILHKAVQSNSKNILEVVIRQIREECKDNFFENLNARDKEGNTPLMRAAMYGWLIPAEILVRNGADFNLINNIGETALDCAAKNRHYELQTLLKACRAQAILRNII